MEPNYFENRNIPTDFYESFRLPAYILPFLPAKESRILDIGCGLGQWLVALERKGFLNLRGIDIAEEAVKFCQKKGLAVENVPVFEDYCRKFSGAKFDFVILSHVLEHVKKNEIVEFLRLIREHLLSERGRLFVAVPNASSNTGAYWAYEDFTHETLFTAGSLLFVLKAAGFKKIAFSDVDGLAGSGFLLRWIKAVLLFLYKMNLALWNHVTSSSFHRPSPQIFTFELKAIASR